ncbi:S-layer homology domain-containing protein [Virgibacillus sp. DJP39]|uniref:S-layer homology domain-containing protein n=1 Tax=Virgibacillus sp. DJP39 TaxID=3409790 RepID=UPI003BB4CECB
MKKTLLSVLMVLLLSVSAFLSPSGVHASTEVDSWEESLESSIKRKSWTNAAIYTKKLAVYYDEHKQYEKAVVYYNDSAKYWGMAGHADWGIVNKIRANHIGTELELYVEKPVTLNKELGKFEPKSGTYLGLFLAGQREHANPDLVEGIYGKNHAIYLTYTTWGKKYENTDSYFPMDFAREAKENGSGIQIGFEPMNGLDEVVDSEYIRQFAKEAKQSGVPVFLRFAGEMNGDWIPWGGDPEKYIEKFRLVHDIMEEEAPNVAMVWSPNFLPRDNIDQFYPGDAYVDWVGLSLYTIPFSHGKEVLGGNPIDYLKPIYEKYKHKPIMISEGAVSHYSYETDKDYSEWAAGQIGNMYGFLPKMFPQVKAITYFNLDKKTTSYDNQNNNYDLGASKIVDERYQRIITSPYFYDNLNLNPLESPVETNYVPVKELTEAEDTHNAFVYAKLPLGKQPYYVAVYQGDKKLGQSYTQPWDMKIDFKNIDPAKPLTIIAYDKNFERLATRKADVSFKHVDKIGKFTDVKDTHWAFSEIEQAEEHGIVTGYPDGSFHPSQPVTVAEFVTILARDFGYGDELEEAGYPKGTLSFMEMKNYPYHDNAGKPITRMEAAEIVSGTQGVNFSGSDAIKYLLVKGLSNGKDPDNISVEGYMGSDTVTRAEAVLFSANIKSQVEKAQERPILPSDPAAIRKAYSTKFE